MKATKYSLIAGLCLAVTPTFAQFGKLKGLIGKKDNAETTTEASAQPANTANEAATATSHVKSKSMAWAAEFERGIDWFKLSATGKLIVATGDALYGIEPATGKTAWKHESLKNLSEDNYHAIANSPFIAIVTGGMLNMQQIILDVSTGKIIANTKELGMKMVSKRFTVPSLGGILFSGYVDNMPSLVFIDAASGEKKWVLNKIFDSASESIMAKPLADGNSLLIATNKRIYKIDPASGSVTWKADFKTNMDDGILLTDLEDEADDKESTRNGEKKSGLMGSLGGLGKVPGLGGLGTAASSASAASKLGGMGGSIKEQTAQLADAAFGKFLILDNQPGVVYYYNNQKMTAFDLANGQPKWQTVSFPDPVAHVLFDERGFLIATNDKRAELFMLDYVTGAQKWKPVTLKGKISALKLNGTSLALASAKESGNNYVNIIDINSGATASKSDMKVSGYIMDIKQNKAGLVYRTNRELNIQDVQTGKDVWAKSLSYKQGGMGVDKGDQTYFWADNQLYKMDIQSGEYKAIGKGLNFSGGEVASAIEAREKGVLISSAQNLALFDWDGNLIYHFYQKAPGTSLANKILNVTAIAVSASQSANAGFQAGLAGPNTSTYNHNMAVADRWSNVGTAALSDMNRRFTATQDAKNFKTILSDINDGDESGYGLVRVNKDTGKLEAKVVLKDKKPDYLTDDTENLVFYKTSNKTITGYKL